MCFCLFRDLKTQASTGLIFKSVVQKAVASNEHEGRAGEEQEQDSMARFIVLYLGRFKDAILVPPGTKLEVNSVCTITSARGLTHAY